ncbi:ATP-binding protein [Streptomyces fuscigenes]|uniref:ATP-binding protein n=1 Tax=Streptomyces fuscigenes TaxID=1528880 RepID=UPI001F2E4460|nr:ATP-binding protein [Streptomyces fuscigenes]MCF3962522.1 ATP-binding protein [Streptomyces fuscigenes]
MARIKEHVAQQQRAARPVELSSPGEWTDTRPRTRTHALPRQPASVAAARHRVRGELRDSDLPSELCDLAELVVSELVTNAVLRTESSVVRCTARVFARGVRVEVTDDGPPPGTMQTGNGMFLVDRIARAWGSEPDRGSGRRTVWASVCLPDAASGIGRQ